MGDDLYGEMGGDVASRDGTEHNTIEGIIW